MDCLRLALKKVDNRHIATLKEWVIKAENFSDDEFFHRIIEISDNHLFLRMWLILKEYYYSLDNHHVDYQRGDYIVLLEALGEKDAGKTLSAYGKLRNLSDF